MAQVTLGTLRRCPRALRHARLPALHRGVSRLGPLFGARTDEHHLAPIQAALVPPFVLPVAAIQGGPSCEGRAVVRDDPVL